MSRIAEARARAGRALAVDSAVRWVQEQENAATLIGGTTHATLSEAHPRPLIEAVATEELAAAADRPESPDSELPAMVRRMFFSPQQAIRSVLFCTAPGEPISTIAWRVAELLVLYSGKRLAFLDDPAAGVTAEPTVPGQRWITRIDQQSGKGVSDLLSSYHFVVRNAMLPPGDDLARMALTFDGVIVVVTEGQTPRSAAEALVGTLRSHDANLLGVVLANRPSAKSQSLFNLAG
jgi:hypothetical protein